MLSLRGWCRSPCRGVGRRGSRRPGSLRLRSPVYSHPTPVATGEPGWGPTEGRAGAEERVGTLGWVGSLQKGGRSSLNSRYATRRQSAPVAASKRSYTPRRRGYDLRRYSVWSRGSSTTSLRDSASARWGTSRSSSRGSPSDGGYVARVGRVRGWSVRCRWGVCEAGWGGSRVVRPVSACGVPLGDQPIYRVVEVQGDPPCRLLPGRQPKGVDRVRCPLTLRQSG